MKHIALIYQLQRYLVSEFGPAVSTEWEKAAVFYQALNYDSTFERLFDDYMSHCYDDSLDDYARSKQMLADYMRENW